jgi:hypothetical protein
MSKLITVYDKMTAPDTSGSSLKGYINLTYNQLVQILGEPTFPEESGDGKVQVEWIVKYQDELFTVYDWKTYDRNYTKNKLDRFNIGGKTSSSYFEDYLERSVR